jgi:site-specific DNA-methyltransferase (adenine-specific)
MVLGYNMIAGATTSDMGRRAGGSPGWKNEAKMSILTAMLKEPLPRLDNAPELYEQLLPFCRLQPGEIWQDSTAGHRVGLIDATDSEQLSALVDAEAPGSRQACQGELPGLTPITLAITDPPYNIKVGKKRSQALSKRSIEAYIDFSRRWVANVIDLLAPNSHLYIWLGADQSEGFQPLPEFMIMMREFPQLRSRSYITVRNQRGYGTQKNWMCARQELLYYTRGNPPFHVVYTEIPKVLKGYYKTIGGRRTENLERSKADTIRPANVWIDIQQVFYRMDENVPGVYAQKPLKAIERIIRSSSDPGDIIIDCFAHSGSTLIAAEKTGRTCYTGDIDPVFAELTIRRLERYRKTGKTGWQCEHPFPELDEKRG